MKIITKLILFVALPVIALVLLAVFAYPAYQRYCIIQDAYDQGIRSIDAEAKSIRQWVLSGKMEQRRQQMNYPGGAQSGSIYLNRRRSLMTMLLA